MSHPHDALFLFVSFLIACASATALRADDVPLRIHFAISGREAQCARKVLALATTSKQGVADGTFTRHNRPCTYELCWQLTASLTGRVAVAR